MDKEEKRLREEIGSLVKEQEEIVALANTEKRSLSDEEGTEFDELQSSIEAKKKQLNRHLTLKENKNDVDNTVGLGEENDTEAHVKSDKNLSEKALEKKADMELMSKTGEIFTLLATKGISEDKKLDRIAEIQKDLYKSGHYDEDRYKAAVDGMNTLTDSDGGIFLPESISDRIFDIAEEYGVFSRYGLRVPMTPGGGKQKLPNLLGELTFYAVNEGSEAKASKLSFSALVLEEQKWMTYIPWTNEMDALKGAMLTQIVLRKLGEALARMRDNAIVNADGSSEYHNLKGFITRSADAKFPEVRLSTAKTGRANFAAITPDDFLSATLDVAKTIRERGRFALDPDWRVYLKQMKDEKGIPYYKGAEGVISVVDNQYFIHGYPVDFTEAIPDTDGASKEYSVFYVPEYFAFADTGQFVIEQFNTGQIPDTDGKSNAINLLSQDMKASRVKTFFDFELSQLTKEYGGVKLGAFTVLRTAAS